ncbi:hypothetical protein GCM10009583_00310 [Ornithinicoccus hortensis]
MFFGGNNTLGVGRHAVLESHKHMQHLADSFAELVEARAGQHHELGCRGERKDSHRFASMQLGGTDKPKSLHDCSGVLRRGHLGHPRSAQRVCWLRLRLTWFVRVNSDVRVDGVSHRFGSRTALNAVTFDLRTGATGLLGPNGAGKTTLLSILTTVRQPSSGSVEVFGHRLNTREGRHAARALIGFLPQRFSVPALMQARDLVAYSAYCHGVERGEVYRCANDALEQVGLSDIAGRRMRSLSGGQRQRVGIAATIAHGPRLLVLDEPTVGLDPEVRIEFRRLISELARERLVVLSTHMVEDVQRSCTNTLVLHEGKVLFHGLTAALEVHEGSWNDEYSSPLEQGYLERLKGA